MFIFQSLSDSFALQYKLSFAFLKLLILILSILTKQYWSEKVFFQLSFIFV